jgi:predicted DNA-binding protein with PD1-like motif
MKIREQAEDFMLKAKRLGFVLPLVAIVTIAIPIMRGQSQEVASDYVAPSQAGPKGKAPRMQVQLLNRGEQTREYAVIFYQGDEAFSGLQEFAEKYHVTSAHFTAIGAVNEATLGWFDPQRKMYKKIPIHGQHEVIGMSGDIALYQGKPVVHTHMVVGSPDGTTHAGHVLAAYVSPTLEVMVTVDPIAMQKRFDPATDLTLIDPAAK